jgi:hypothetical protein
MAFNITSFKSAMKYDGARPNLFQVNIPALGGFPAGNQGETHDKFFIRASSLPGSTLGTVVVPYFGREVKFAGNRTFADWTVTVINDESFSLRGRFETWMQQINSHAGNMRGVGNPPGSYTNTADVSQLSKKGTEDTPLRKYTFHNMFPIDLSEITLDWGDNDSIEEFTCTFAYDFWVADSASSPSKADPVLPTIS